MRTLSTLYLTSFVLCVCLIKNSFSSNNEKSFAESEDSKIDDAEGQIVDAKRSMGGGKVHFLRSLRFYPEDYDITVDSDSVQSLGNEKEESVNDNEMTEKDDEVEKSMDPRATRGKLGKNAHFLRSLRAPSHFLRSLRAPSSHFLRPLRAPKTHFLRSLRAPDAHFLRSLRAPDAHFLRSLRAPSAHFLRSLRAPDAHFLRSLRAPDAHFLRSLRAPSQHFLRSLRAPSAHFLRSLRAPDAHFLRSLRAPKSHFLRSLRSTDAEEKRAGSHFLRSLRSIASRQNFLRSLREDSEMSNVSDETDDGASDSASEDDLSEQNMIGFSDYGGALGGNYLRIN